ncbi:MAG: hypothetical protein FD160_1611, partial [Caulobacteraceae bacterium]
MGAPWAQGAGSARLERRETIAPQTPSSSQCVAIVIGFEQCVGEDDEFSRDGGESETFGFSRFDETVV